jgi:uracil-DNA glycosylase
MDVSKVTIEESWKKILADEFAKEYFDEIKRFLVSQKKQGKVIYPKGSHIFHAFDKTPFESVKIVIVGQDPYHGPGEAMGLSFSVPEGVRIPPSLLNIFKEIKSDLGYNIPAHGDLTGWAEQGVFLLNAILTVALKSPASHRSIGWEIFTDSVIKHLSDIKKDLIFMLWGKYAQSKISLIDQYRHHLLIAAHPSPLARQGFLGCQHFSKANELLIQGGKKPILWNLQNQSNEK